MIESYITSSNISPIPTKIELSNLVSEDGIFSVDYVMKNVDLKGTLTIDFFNGKANIHTNGLGEVFAKQVLHAIFVEGEIVE